MKTISQRVVKALNQPVVPARFSGSDLTCRPRRVSRRQFSEANEINKTNKTNKTNEINGINESGYALVGLIGIMLFSLIITTAAAPKVLFESKREKEEEMLWRGQQVASALTLFTAARNGQYPTELNQLVEGFDTGARRLRFLRPSALCDPMMPCDSSEDGNWRTVHPGDPLVRELLEAYLAAQMKPGSNLPPPPQSLVMFAQMSGRRASGDPGSATSDMSAGGNLSSGMPGMPGMGQSSLSGSSGGGFSGGGFSGGGLSGGGLSGGFGQSNGAGGGEPTGSMGSGSSLGFSGDGNRPIIGVVSRKSDRMFRTYFGIEFYDHSLFFPSVPIVAGGLVSPQTLVAMGGTAGTAPRCTGGGVLINGRCWGGLTPGALCRGEDGVSIPCQR